MEMVDCRRLTGPNLVSAEPCAVLEADLAPEEADEVIEEWTRQARRMLDAVGWQHETTAVHRGIGGATFVISAPADGLYAATEIAEWAWTATCAVRSGDEAPDFDADAVALRRVIDEEANPPLLELATAARTHGVTFLADEERASVGLGTGVRSWPVRALPAVADVPWKGVHDIPLALVAGSHGKTTCVRLVAAIARAAGRRAGCSTSDAISIGEEIVERGDCADCESARDLLRERRVQLALLETPREELAHRGLPVRRATAAIITSLSEAPTADYGARSAEEIAELTWIVSSALGDARPLVLNADEPALVARAAHVTLPIVWYGTHPQSKVIGAHFERGGTAWTVRDGVIGHQRGRQWRGVLSTADLPGAGAAPLEVDNALAAAALAQALGLPDRAIGAGLSAVQAEPAQTERRA